MFCKKCGNELKKTAKFCDKCGQKADENSFNEKTVNVNINEKVAVPYATAKLIIGIISMVLFLIICVQSCAAGLNNTISENGETSGSAGFLCAIFMLVGGIISVITRNSKGKSGSITAIIMYFIGSLLTIGTGSSYSDLPVWGSIAFIFGLINLASILVNNNFFKKKKNRKFLTIGLVILSVVAFIISLSSGSSSNNTQKENNNNSTPANSETNDSKNKYSLNETFKFDDLEITIGSNILYTTVSNRFSDYNGKEVVKIPVTVKNLKDETHSLNMFYYKVFGSQGTELDSISSYFDDDCIDYAGDLRSEASYTKYFYFLYDGNGTYAIEFDNWSNKIIVEFDINK